MCEFIVYNALQIVEDVCSYIVFLLLIIKQNKDKKTICKLQQHPPHRLPVYPGRHSQM